MADESHTESSNTSFETYVEQAVRSLPDWVERLLNTHGIEIVIRNRPPKSVRNDFGENVFGLFTGQPLSQQRSPGMVKQPTRIELYKKIFEHSFSSNENLKEQVRKTVVHEVGHFMGMDEEQIRKHGY